MRLRLLHRLAVSAIASMATGTAATSAIPDAHHWPVPSIAVIVAAVSMLGGLLSKLLHIVAASAVIVAAAVVADVATHGQVHQLLSLHLH